MAIVTTDNKYYAEIANAIRTVNGSTDKYLPAQMAAAILALMGGSGLPDGYTLLEYIQASGSQYIDTGIIPTNHQTEIKFDMMDYKDNDHLFGTSADYRKYSFTSYANEFRSGINGVEITIAPWSTGVHTLLYNTIDNYGIYLDGKLYSSGTLCASTTNLTLCRRGTNGLTGRIYYAKITDRSSGLLVRDFVPCISPDGVYGLYDLINAQFYGGSGTFTGQKALPASYTRLSYIESSGTQYIDTGFVPNQDTRVACEFEYTTAGYVFGAENAYRSNSFDFYTRLAVYNATSTVFTALSTSAKHSVDFNKNVVSVDGSTKVTFTYASFSSGLPLFLFAVNSGGNGIEGIIGKIYSCQIYNNGTMVRDYVPCRKNDGVVGMYDFITNKFYKNAGTGSFVAGAEVI